MQKYDTKSLITAGLRVLEIEAASLNHIASKLNDEFAKACIALLQCNGRIIVMGIGKSGHVASKIAATLASTGTPAFFVHPAEAAHGDIGMVTADDVLIFVSKSGETKEIIEFIPLLKRMGNTLINLSGNPASTLGKLAHINLDTSVPQEACSLGLAPTASTTAAMAMGDALAVSVLQARGFTEEDFARSHPGGLLGRKLLVKISDIMHSAEDLPKVHAGTKLADAIIEISHKRLGMTTVVASTDPNKIIGIFTDGDLRRAFENNVDITQTQIQDLMTRSFKTVYADMLAAEAVLLMQQHKISALPVIDREDNLVGAFNIHDVFKAGVV